MNIESEVLQKHYPFKLNRLELNNGNATNYIDEGEGDPIVMVHGNPTWSFYYRNLVNEFKDRYRVIVPDHMGCGFSDKPQDYEYTLDNHVKNLNALIERLELKNITLVVHDWGGAIGMGHAVTNPANIKKIVIFNSAAFRSQSIPATINLCKMAGIGEFIVRHFNAFAYPATFMAVEKPLPQDVKKAYLLPYGNYHDRVAVANFVKDIPLREDHRTYPTLTNIEENLQHLNCPKLIVWGGKDFCFHKEFFDRWLEFFPDAETMYLDKAGHYVLEDAIDEIIPRLNEFIN